MRGIQGAFERFLSLTRLLVLIPVIFLLVDAAASFIYGTDILVRTASGVVGAPSKVGGRLGVFLVVMDTFLVGATLMVASFGFYELFVVRHKPRDQYWLPSWLRMRDLEDLKGRVVSMLILVAAITFVDHAVESHDEHEVLFLGLGVSIIIVALTFFLWYGKRNGTTPNPEPAVVPDGGNPAGGATGADGMGGGGTDGGTGTGRTDGGTGTGRTGPGGTGVGGTAASSGPASSVEAGGEGRGSKAYERNASTHCDRPATPRVRYCAGRSNGGGRTVNGRNRHGDQGTTPLDNTPGPGRTASGSPRCRYPCPSGSNGAAPMTLEQHRGRPDVATRARPVATGAPRCRDAGTPGAAR